MKHPGWLIAFIIGLMLGISGPLFAPKFLVPHLPQALQGNTETVEGLVTLKQKENNQLLLTVSAPNGATLVTFIKNAKEMDMLVELHDRITLSVRHYEPFLFDPKVIQVKKSQDVPATPATKLPVGEIKNSPTGNIPTVNPFLGAGGESSRRSLPIKGAP